MIRKVSREYIELKKVIDSYIDKYSTPTRKSNLEKLTRLKSMGAISKNKDYYKLRDEIALSNGGFAMTYVMRYYNVLNDDTSISELFQEAIIGLIETIDEFKLEKKTSFTTYAYFHIKKRLIDFIKHNKLVRAPRDIARNIKHVSEAQNKLLLNLKREPTEEEIKKYLNKIGINVKEKIIEQILILLELNSSGNDEPFVSEYRDQLSYEENSDVFREMEISLMRELSKFDERQKEIITSRFGIGRECPHSIDEIKLIFNLDDNDIDSI